VDSIEIVFFDAGETLLRPHPSFAELFSRTCRRNGFDIAADDVDRVQRSMAPHLIDLVEEGEEIQEVAPYSSLTEEDSNRFWSYLYRRFLKELEIVNEDLTQQLLKVFSDSSSYKLFDDVMPTLDQISSAGFRLGLISNFESWLEEMLVELEVGHHFEPAIISGVEGVEKPDPAIYELALERAGVSSKQAVHVGDSPELDMEPASSVGIRGILLDRADRYPQSEHPRVSSLEELLPLLANL
jgi:putative hydrolase of the HAD superfamily